MPDQPVPRRPRVPPDEPPLVKVSSPADLAQVVPYLMGFHPTSSLVIVGLADRRVRVSARVDLAELLDDDADRRLTGTLTAMAGSGVERFVGIVYDDEALPAGRHDHGTLPWAGIAAMLDAEVGRVGYELDDIALVSGGRIYSYVCHLPACCPPGGRPLDSASTAAAEATYAGLVALPDRASLAALLDPLVDRQRDALLPALNSAESEAVGALVHDGGRADRSAKRALFAAARAADAAAAALMTSLPELTESALVGHAVALQRRQVRDRVWLAVDHGRIDGRGLWRAMARRLPAPFDAPALFLFAWASYREGDGALARIAAERALESDPGYSPADLVLAALSHAIDPHRLPKLPDSRAQRGKSRTSRESRSPGCRARSPASPSARRRTA
jgi:Domain of unknown function (DUF4192)